jgi:plasmid stabilization system protein ParE
MIIEKSERFIEELEEIIFFIAEDSKNRALIFYDELIEKIREIVFAPYIYRKKENLDNENIRELIFKGYVIPFFIDTQKEKIIILGIFNQNQWSLNDD